MESMERTAGTARNLAIAARVEPSTLPLCVDLDGTLLATDTLQEAAIGACMADPRVILALPGWLAQSKARLKEELARRWDFDPAHLPYHREFVAYLQEQKARGRMLVLATAADCRIAQKIADHLNLFDEVIASDGTRNLSGAAKAAALIERFGAKGFVYAGNARADLAVWREAAASVVVAAPKRVSAAAAAEGPVIHTVARQDPMLRGLVRALRPHPPASMGQEPAGLRTAGLRRGLRQYG
jgi:hypothetical protein